MLLMVTTHSMLIILANQKSLKMCKGLGKHEKGLSEHEKGLRK